MSKLTKTQKVDFYTYCQTCTLRLLSEDMTALENRKGSKNKIVRAYCLTWAYYPALPYHM